MRRVMAVGTFLATLFAQSAVALDLSELCGDFGFLKSEPSVYRGEFARDGATLDHALVLAKETNGNRVLAFYVFGEQPKWRINRGGCRPVFGTMDGNTLVLKLQRWITVTYEFDGNAEASVEYVVRRRDGGTSTTAGRVAPRK